MTKKYSVGMLITALWGFDLDSEPSVTLAEVASLYEVLDTDKYKPLLKSIEQAHIDSDDHARRCDDENCNECDYDSSDVDYGDYDPSA